MSGAESRAPGPRAAAAAGARGAWGRWLVAGGLVLACAGFFALGGPRYLTWDSLLANRDALKGWVGRHYLPALVGFLGLYVAVAALSLPAAAVLSLAAGALFGLWVGTGLVSVASTLGATLALLATRYLFRDAVR